MIKNFKILAVVPARGGSKGIKLKNLRKINGKPLISIVADFIKKCKFLDYSVISTDHFKIAKLGKQKGLTLIRRPKNLSGDKVSDLKVLIHATKEFEKKYFKKVDIVVMLHPTSPLRKKKDLFQTIQLLIKNQKDSVWTISKTSDKYHPMKQLTFKNGNLNYYSKKGSKIFYRQQLSQIYHRNSNSYVIWKKILLKKKTLMTNNTGGFIVNSPQVSIDNENDIKFIKNYF